MGITTLARARRARRRTLLVAAFGANHGPDLQRRARFEGSASVEPVREAVSESHETTFDYDIADPRELEASSPASRAQLCERLRRAGAPRAQRSRSRFA